MHGFLAVLKKGLVWEDGAMAKKEEDSSTERQDNVARFFTCLAILAVVVWWFNSTPSGTNNPHNPYRTLDRVVSDGPILGCEDADDLQRVEGYFASGDNVAGTRALYEVVRAGFCVQLNDGEKVVIEKAGGADDLFQHAAVRRPGETVAYWVTHKHLK